MLLSAAPASATWLANGNKIVTGVHYPDGNVPVSAASDGQGGVYIASGESIDGSRLTRILATGEIVSGWSADGIYWSGGIWWPYEPQAISDDAGGAFVISTDQGCLGAHCVGNLTDLRAHHVDPGGSITAGWPAEGFDLGSVREREFDRRQAMSIPSGRGSVLTTWANLVGDYHFPTLGGELRAQRVDISGAMPWGASGVLLHSAAVSRQYEQAMAPDGMGGAFVFWLDDRAPGIFGQHVAADGSVLWQTDGIPISTAPFTDLGRPVAVSDGAHGAIVAWSGTSGSRSGIFAARVGSSGALAWRGREQVFAAAASHVDGLQMVPADAGGAILAWRFLSVGGDHQILAQSLDHGGPHRWSDPGVMVCQAPGTRDHIVMADDGEGGTYLAWIDGRPAFSLFGMHLDRSGARLEGWSSDGEPICARLPLPATSGGGTAVVTDLELTTLDGPRHGGAREERAASAILLWADNRTPFSIFTVGSPFAMLLTPHGPAAAPATELPAPISVSPADYSRASSDPAAFWLRAGSAAGQRVHLSLVEGSAARLELFDVSGRRIWSRSLDGLSAGVHELRLGDGAWYPSGVYLARLTQGNRVAGLRVALVH